MDIVMNFKILILKRIYKFWLVNLLLINLRLLKNGRPFFKCYGNLYFWDTDAAFKYIFYKGFLIYRVF